MKIKRGVIMKNFEKMSNDEVLQKNKEYWIFFKTLKCIIDDDSKKIKINQYMDVLKSSILSIKNNDAKSIKYLEAIQLAKINFNVYESFIKNNILK